MKTTVRITREVPDCEGGFEEVEYEVSCHVSPLIPAVTTGPVENSHPEEGGDVEILKVTEVGTNKEVNLEFSSEEHADIDERALEQAAESDDGPEWDDDDRWDQRHYCDD